MFEIRIKKTGKKLASFLVYEDAEEYTPSISTARKFLKGSYSSDDLEIIKVVIQYKNMS